MARVGTTHKLSTAGGIYRLAANVRGVSVTLKIAPPANGTVRALCHFGQTGVQLHSCNTNPCRCDSAFFFFFPSLFSSGFVFCFPVVCQRQFQSEGADEAEIDCDTQPDYVTGLTEAVSPEHRHTTLTAVCSLLAAAVLKRPTHRQFVFDVCVCMYVLCLCVYL